KWTIIRAGNWRAIRHWAVVARTMKEARPSADSRWLCPSRDARINARCGDVAMCATMSACLPTGRHMALLYMLLVVALIWSLGALQLWPRMRWVRELPLWLGGALAVGVAACVAWGVVGVLRIGDWQAVSMDQAVNRVFGAGSLWFQRSGWGLLDRVANVYASLDIA